MASDTIVLHPNDVIFGRGRRVSSWPGNVTFRQIVWSKRSMHQAFPRQLRHQISQQVVSEVLSTGGRFLQMESDGTYSVASLKRAIEKAAQTLRETDMKKPMGYEQSSVASRSQTTSKKLVKRLPVQTVVTPSRTEVTNTLLQCKAISSDESSVAGPIVLQKEDVFQKAERRPPVELPLPDDFLDGISSKIFDDECGFDSHTQSDVGINRREQSIFHISNALDQTQHKNLDYTDYGAIISNYVPPTDLSTVISPSCYGLSNAYPDIGVYSELPLHMRTFFQSLYPNERDVASAVSFSSEDEFTPNHMLNPFSGCMGMHANRMNYLESPATVVEDDNTGFPTHFSRSLTVLLGTNGVVADSNDDLRDFEPLDAWRTLIN